jgi:hypothetical protein
MSETSSKKRKLSLPLVLAGGVSSLVLALGMSPTFSAFSASIQNTVDTAGSGTLVMQETNAAGTVTCSSDAAGISTNSATCITIDKYGANLGMIPGQTVTTTINIKNTGTIVANAFSLTPGACGQSANGTSNGTAMDLCSKINVVIVSGAKPIYSGTALALGTGGAINLLTLLSVPSIAAPSTTPFTFSVTLDASVGNSYQGLKVLQGMTWGFQS